MQVAVAIGVLQVAAAIGVCKGKLRGGVANGIECQQLEMKFVVQFRSLSPLFLSLSLALFLLPPRTKCVNSALILNHRTQSGKHTSTHTYTHRDKHTHSGPLALPNIFVNKLLHTFRQLLQLHLDAVLRLPQHPSLSPAPDVTLSSLLFPLPFYLPL